MKSTEEIAEKLNAAAADLINSHGREIEKIRNESDGKIALRFHCAIKNGAMKTRLMFAAVAVKDQVENELDGQELLPGLETKSSRKRKKPVETRA